MIVLIGIDDTDNPETRGTGYQARTMAGVLTGNGLARILGITRHQHFVHPDIPYTSHNSSACIMADIADRQAVWDACSQYLSVAAAPGSDVGLAIALPGEISPDLTLWAYRTKKEVVGMEDARCFAKDTGIWLEGFTGNRQGIIGAMASTALRHSGNDGRFIATGSNFHLRELHPGSYTVQELLSITHADQITQTDFSKIDPNSTILVKEFLRPVLHDQKCTILVTKTETDHDWESAGKDFIRCF